ncbi:hypothetical protein JCM14036_30420 [Desulfotomaculum defluvii]
MYKEHSLFPRDSRELAAASFKTVMQTLEKERVMRRQVFRNDPSKRDQKVSEIDTALAELKILYRLAVENQRN